MEGKKESVEIAPAFLAPKRRVLYLRGAAQIARVLQESAPSMLNMEDYLAFAHAKAFDVISSGHFKRHLGACRENGDKWAVVMYNRQNKVAARLREVFTLVGQLTTPRAKQIQQVCKDVMSCAQPPIKVVTGENTCCLTGTKTEHCIDLTRMGKNSKEVLVHPRFWHFFVLLWFCAKLEYVIRACTKQWLESMKIKPEPKNYTEICEEYIQSTVDDNERMFQLLERALDYTTQSLSLYRDKYALRPVLQEKTPPSDEEQ